MQDAGDLRVCALLHKLSVFFFAVRLGVHRQLCHEHTGAKNDAAEAAGACGNAACFTAGRQQEQGGVIGFVAVVACSFGGEEDGSVFGDRGRSDRG